MGRPPLGGAPSFRFLPSETADMEKALEESKGANPPRDTVLYLAEKFSAEREQLGKLTVQWKQIWNWFQNRRHAQRSKSAKMAVKLNSISSSSDDSLAKRASTNSFASLSGRKVPDSQKMEFEARSARDQAWYDVAGFLTHRMLELDDPEVQVRFEGFGAEEDEWVNVKRSVRRRSLPCEVSECIAVLPGDLILCFQEGKEQALYYDAHVLDVQRKQHDIRGCRCRFLVQYDHDQIEEVVPLRKVCRRPETDFRLQALHASKRSSPTELGQGLQESKEISTGKISFVSSKEPKGIGNSMESHNQPAAMPMISFGDALTSAKSQPCLPDSALNSSERGGNPSTSSSIPQILDLKAADAEMKLVDQ